MMDDMTSATCHHCGRWTDQDDELEDWLELSIGAVCGDCIAEHYPDPSGHPEGVEELDAPGVAQIGAKVAVDHVVHHWSGRDGEIQTQEEMAKALLPLMAAQRDAWELALLFVAAIHEALTREGPGA